jgi:tRNA(adenine34) deaminase
VNQGSKNPDLNGRDQHWMNAALDLANRARSLGEVPVGAIVIKDGEIVGKGWNQTIAGNDPSAHAEIVALRDAGQQLDNYRMPGCILYVTLEPCIMCAGAMIHARLDRLVYGAPDAKTGAAGGRFNTLLDDRHNHQLEVTGGCMAQTCGDLLQQFFRERR